MPLYEYMDMKTGRLWEEMRPIRCRDMVPPGVARVTVPSRLSFIEKLPEPGRVENTTPKAIRDMERQLGTAELERQMGQKRSTIQKAWNFQSTYRD